MRTTTGGKAHEALDVTPNTQQASVSVSLEQQ